MGIERGVLRRGPGAGESEARVVRGAPSLRRWLIAASVLLVATGMAYSLAWGPVVEHGSYWVTPGDIWGTFRAAHFVGWGDIGDVYDKGTGLVTFPGIAVLLAPIAILSGHLGLSESLPFYLPHPTAWLVLGPVELLLGATVFFPLDALATNIGARRGQRLAMLAASFVILWPVVAIWGHPEDAVAMTLSLYALDGALRSRWRSAGWLFGGAMAVQPLVIVVLPVLLGFAPGRERWKLVAKAIVPVACLCALPLEQSWHQTSTALLQQPNYPSIDHATPWVALAPVLSPARHVLVHRFGEVTSHGLSGYSAWWSTTTLGKVVAAGPGRLIAIALALALGWWIAHRKPRPETIVWLAAVALSLRCFFEAVMNPYYLWPPLAVVVVLAATRSWRRFGFVVASGLLCSVSSYHRAGPWAWYLPVALLLGMSLLWSRPSRDRAVPQPDAVSAWAAQASDMSPDPGILSPV